MADVYSLDGNRHMKVLRTDRYPTVPWRNGGGTTREIAVHYDQSRHDDFLWRLSIATVAKSGPFSRFEDVDRTLALIDGDGMLLRSPSMGTRLTADTPPFSFCGEEEILCELDGGYTTDLNAMTRRGFFGHTLRRQRLMGWSTVRGTADETLIVSNALLALSFRGGGCLRPLDTIAGISRGMSVDLYSESLAEIFVMELTAS